MHDNEFYQRHSCFIEYQSLICFNILYCKTAYPEKTTGCHQGNFSRSTLPPERMIAVRLFLNVAG
jgi:hypothetical protein